MKSILNFTILVLIFFSAGNSLFAQKKHIIKPGRDGYFVKSNWNDISAGDTIFFSGYFKSIHIENLNGTKEKYIVITNLKNEHLIIGDSLWTGGAWAAALVFINCHYINVGGNKKDNFTISGSQSLKDDGNGYPVKSAYYNLQIGDKSDNFKVHDITIRYGGVGVWAKTEVNAKDASTWYPSKILTNWEFYRLDIGYTYNEGMYIGHTATYWNIITNTPYYPNISDPIPDSLTFKKALKLRNVKIHDVFVHDTGNDGIQTAAIENLVISNNEVTHWSAKKKFTDAGGILIGGRVQNFKVYNNIVHDGYGDIIQVFADAGEAEISNNLLFNSFGGEGISLRTVNKTAVTIKYNSIINTFSHSIRVNGYFGGTKPHILKNNFFAAPNTSGQPVYTNAWIYLENGGQVKDDNTNRKEISFADKILLQSGKPDKKQFFKNEGYLPGRKMN